MSQVDFVPTISLMLGIPVPFSNLGTVIVDLFDCDQSRLNSLQSVQQKLTALQLNAEQVQRFLHEYSRQSNDLPQSELNTLDQYLSLAENELKNLFSELSTSGNISGEAVSALADRYIDYLARVRGLCRSVWSKFDLVTMAAGGSVIVCAFLFNVVIAVCETKPVQLSAVTMAVSVVGLSAVVNLLQLLHSDLVVLLTIFAVASFLITIFVRIRSCIFTRLSWSNWSVETFSVLLCCVHSISLLSNSFVVYEDHSALFLVQSLLAAVIASQTSLFLCQRLSAVDSAAKRRMLKELPMTLVHSLLLVVALAVCVRMSAMFRCCREEQIDCELSWFAQPLAAIPANFEHFKYARLTVSVVSVITVIVVVTVWFRHCGNLNGWEPSVVAMCYVIPVTGFCLCVYWLVDGCVLHDSTVRMVAASVTALPRLVYVMSLATVVIVAKSPVCLFVIRPQQAGTVNEAGIDQLHNMSHEELIPQIYNHVRKNWRSVLKSPDVSSRPVDDIPVVYGLATLYSAGHIVLLIAVAMVMMLVLGDNMAPSVALWLVCEVCLLELHAANAHCQAGGGMLCNFIQFVIS